MARSGRNSKALRTEIVETDFGSTGGAYRLAMLSTELTGVAAKTASAGHVAAFRNASSTLEVQIDAIEVKAWMTVMPTALQEVGLQLFMFRGTTPNYTGGAAATITTNNGKKRTSHPTLADIELRCGTTGALTVPATLTLDAQCFAAGGMYVMAANAAAHQHGGFEVTYKPAPGVGKILLAQNEGFIVANSVALGTALKMNISVAVDFHVLDTNSTYVP